MWFWHVNLSNVFIGFLLVISISAFFSSIDMFRFLILIYLHELLLVVVNKYLNDSIWNDIQVALFEKLKLDKSREQ